MADGMRMLFYVGEDRSIGGYPHLQVDICDVCHRGEVEGNEGEWMPALNKRHHGIDEAELQEMLDEKEEVWEWLDSCAEVFIGSGYKCNQCEVELTDGV